MQILKKINFTQFNEKILKNFQNIYDSSQLFQMIKLLLETIRLFYEKYDYISRSSYCYGIISS